MKEVKNFIDAQEMSKGIEKFEAPSKEDLDNLKSGDWVKICIAAERFWISVYNVNGDDVNGVIDNDLVATKDHGYKFADFVKFEKRHIYQIEKT